VVEQVVEVLLLLTLLVILELPIQVVEVVVLTEDHHQITTLEVQVVQVSWLQDRVKQELF
jgi:hypothetical protein